MQNRRCGGCGYDLMGIAHEGQCPECGRRYDVETGHGTDARRRPWLEQYFKTAALLVCAVLVMGCSGVLALLARRPTGLLVAGMAVAGVVLLGALYCYFSERQLAREEDEANR